MGGELVLIGFGILGVLMIIALLPLLANIAVGIIILGILFWMIWILPFQIGEALEEDNKPTSEYEQSINSDTSSYEQSSSVENAPQKDMSGDNNTALFVALLFFVIIIGGFKDKILEAAGRNSCGLPDYETKKNSKSKS